MKDLIITINGDTGGAVASSTYIGYEGENDIHSLIFDFTNKADFLEGTPYVDILTSTYRATIRMEVDNINKYYKIPIKASLVKESGEIRIQLKVLKTDADSVVIFKSDVVTLNVRDSIFSESTIEDDYPNVDLMLIEIYESSASFPVKGNLYTIYCAKDNGKHYIWNGTKYICISEDVSSELATIKEDISTNRSKIQAVETSVEQETKDRLDAYSYVRKDIGSRLAELKEAIASGNPEKYGFHEGDYFSIGGYKYILADYDHWYGSYDSYSVIAKRHWGVIVDTGATHAWNSNGSTNGGYVASELHAYLVDTVLPKIESDLTPHGLSLIANQRLYSTAMNPSGVNRYGSASGCASSWSWSANQKISAPTEIEIYGSVAWSSSGYDTGEGCKPLKAFQRFRFNELLPWRYFWLRDIASASHACYANSCGKANNDSVTNADHVVGLIGVY